MDGICHWGKCRLRPSIQMMIYVSYFFWFFTVTCPRIKKQIFRAKKPKTSLWSLGCSFAIIITCSYGRGRHKSKHLGESEKVADIFSENEEAKKAYILLYFSSERREDVKSYFMFGATQSNGNQSCFPDHNLDSGPEVEMRFEFLAGTRKLPLF